MSLVINRSFASGEIAPALLSRVDVTRYQSGLRTCKNFVVLRHGGISNRAGTQFIGEVSNSAKTVRLLPFIFNANQTYVLEFGDLYIRFIQDGAYITLAAKTITGITTAAQAVVTSAAHGYANGDEVYISGVVGMTELNNRNFKVSDQTANTYKLKYMDGSTYVSSVSFGAYTSGGTSEEIYTVTTTYTEAEVADIKIVQSADVITIVHPSHAPAELSRIADDNWSLANITFAPSLSPPTGVSATGGAGATVKWVVTSIKTETLEESIASSSVSKAVAYPHTITWTNASGAQEYNVYKSLNGIYGFIGVASDGTSGFIDTGITAETTDTPPITRNPFGSTDNYPATVSYFQQRRVFANTNNDPEKVWASRTGKFSNFTISSPLAEDDAVTFSLAGRQVNAIKNLIELGKLITFTAAGEWIIEGNASGILTPFEINPRQHSYNGSSDLIPLIVGGSALYLQARNSIVRDLTFDFQIDGYRGNDLTIFSAHLFDNYTITDWAYQQIPQSIVWAVRNDGTLLGLTYVKEQQIIGWHRHDLGGTVENVCVVPEGSEDALYVVVNRTVNGSTKRYVERFASRQIVDIVDSVFVDAHLSYDGRNTAATTMTISGSGFTYEDTLTLTASASFFTAADIGNEIHLTGSDGTVIRFEITGFTGVTVVTGRPNQTVPVVMRSVAILIWTKAVDVITGIWHLEGKNVSVFADGFVVANPNNAAYVTVTVANGSITLDRPYGVIHVGLPYTSDMETLDIDTAQGETMADRKKNINRLSVYVESSRGIWAGSTPPADEDDDFLGGLTELKIRNSEGYNESVDLASGVVEVIIRPEWNSNGRIFIRQSDPIPLSVLAVAPSGFIPTKGGG